MWYVIHASDREDSLEARKAARPAHLERVQVLIDQGRLLVAGPMPNIDSPDPGPAGFSGSTIIAEFESLEDARHNGPALIPTWRPVCMSMLMSGPL